MISALIAVVCGSFLAGAVVGLLTFIAMMVWHIDNELGKLKGQK